MSANEYWEGGEVYVVPDGPCSPPMLVLLEGWEFLKSEFLLGWWHLQEHGYSQNQRCPQGGYPEGKCGHSKKNIPKVSLREETPRPRCGHKRKTSPW
jgi:hypothetical protein